MSDAEELTKFEEPTEPPAPFWLKHAAPLAAGAWAAVVIAGGAAWCSGRGADLGVFGDAFGVVTGLLTGLALLASVRSIDLQRQELAATRAEMRLQRGEMATSREVVAQQLAEMKRGNDIQAIGHSITIGELRRAANLEERQARAAAEKQIGTLADPEAQLVALNLLESLAVGLNSDQILADAQLPSHVERALRAFSHAEWRARSLDGLDAELFGLGRRSDRVAGDGGVWVYSGPIEGSPNAGQF